MAKISVIVPVYKVEKYIKRCVESILAQTFTDFELILVDDGSPDNCGQICEQYAAKDGRTRVLHRKNGGLSAARNTGIDWVFKYSDSEWLTFIDSDDWVHKEYLEILYKAAVGHQVSVSICGYKETLGENTEVQKEQKCVKKYSVRKYYREHTANATVAWGKLYKKNCFEKIRYPEGKIHEDEYVTYRILFRFQDIAVVEAPLYSYYINREGITKSTWNPKRMDVFRAFEQQISFFGKNGMTDLQEMRVGNYLWNVEQQMNAFDSVKSSYGCKYERKLRRRLGSILLRWKQKYPFEKNKKRYETAFPKGMWLYWNVEGIKHKFLKRK